MQRSPSAASAGGEAGGDEGEVVAIVFGLPEAGAGGHHVAVVFGETFVDPEQVVLHRFLVVGREETGGAAMFAVPGMEVFVREQACEGFEGVVVDQCPLVGAVVGALMMLEAVVAGSVAEREEEVVTLVVAGAEEGGELGGNELVGFQPFVVESEGGFAVGGDVDDVRRLRAGGEVDLFEVAAGEEGLVDEHLERDGFEVDCAVGRRAGGLAPSSSRTSSRRGERRTARQ